MSFSFIEGNSYEEYQQQIKKLNGKTAEEYKAQILARLPEFRKQITQSKESPAYKEIINTDLELSAALKIIETERNLKLAHIMTNGLEGEKANKYYAETKIDIPQGYYESLQEFTYILSPKASYNSRYPILFDIIRRIGIDDKILKSLSNHTATGVSSRQIGCDSQTNGKVRYEETACFSARFPLEQMFQGDFYTLPPKATDLLDHKYSAFCRN